MKISKKGNAVWKSVILFIIICFFITIFFPMMLRVKNLDAQVLKLPQPLQMLKLSKAYSLPVLKGLKLDPTDPLNIEFYIDTQDRSKVSANDVNTLINYFLAALTVPKEELWVNLSPYEHDRIISDKLDKTDLGKDLLSQDYILKQLSSSLTHPDTSIGRAYWDNQERDVDGFNKIWIVPESASVVEKDHFVFITESLLGVRSEKAQDSVLFSSLTKDINKGKNFNSLRQIYSAIVLALWFKDKFHKSFFKFYLDQGKTSGIDLNDHAIKDKIWKLYCKSFAKGVYNLSKGSSKKKQYFSGGFNVPGNFSVTSSTLHDQKKFNEIVQGFIDKGLYKTSISINVASSSISRLVKEVLDVGRGLVRTDNVDALDYELFNEAKRQNKQYLRLTLKDLTELSSYMVNIKVDDGKFEKLKGPLATIIENGGILLIDYNNSDPQIIEGFNSLFDKNAFYKNIKAHPQLQVVAAKREKDFLRLDTTSRSRFVVSNKVDFTYSDPLDTIKQLPDGVDAVKIQGHGSPFFKRELIGRAGYDEDGVIKMHPGEFHKAVLKYKSEIDAGQDPQPIVIQGDVWNNEDFLRFFRDIAMKGGYFYNSAFIELPQNIAIYREAIDYTQNIKNKTISPLENRIDDEYWIVNSQTQDLLFSQSHIDNTSKRLKQYPGLLESQDKLLLRIDTKLDDWVWHKIMHSDCEIIIELGPKVYVPHKYRKLVPNLKKTTSAEPEVKALSDVKGQKVVLVEFDDIVLSRRTIETDIDDKSVFYPIGVDTTQSQLFTGIEVNDDLTENTREYTAVEKGILTLLNEGKTVVLDGLDSNPSLLEYLQTTLGENPYVYNNGQRIELNDLPGKLILTTKHDETKKHNAQQHVYIKSDLKKIESMLSNNCEFFDKELFDKIMQLKELCDKLPSADPVGLYPAIAPLSYAKLEMIFSDSSDVFSKMEDILISEYYFSQEKAAYLRTMARLIFQNDHTVQNSKTINGAQLFELIDNLNNRLSLDDIYWQLVDTLSLDLLRGLVGESIVGNDVTSIYELQKILAPALIDYYADDPARQQYYRSRFGRVSEMQSEIASISMKLPLVKENWPSRKARSLRILKKYGAVFLKGSPGTGKSHITDILAKELGFSKENIVGAITVGVDVKEADLIGKQKFKDDKTKFVQGEIGEWIPEGTKEDAQDREQRLFVVDEANLTQENFWNFLSAFFEKDDSKRYVWIDGQRRFFNPRDKLIYTGNQETVTGRKYQDLISQYMLSVNFDEFSRDFYNERLKEEYLTVDSQPLRDMILDLHDVFSGIDRSKVFSLRDIQELAVRVNTFVGNDWDVDKVVYQAWKQYHGMFSADEVRALERLIYKKFGIKVWEMVDDEIQGYVEAYSELFFDQYKLSLTPSAADMAILVEDFLRIRSKRIEEGISATQGKRAMIFEGPSGRGKDFLLDAILDRLGFDQDNSTGNNRVYTVNASMDTETMIETIETAQDEGAVLIIREMNMLPSAFLEGQLNDVLTGNAQPGFVLFVTMNSVDYSGREDLSTAMQNRTLYNRIEDYTQAELRTILYDNVNGVSSRDMDYVLKVHCKIRQIVERSNQKPATRDIINALELMRDKKMTAEDAVDKIYGDYYLRGLLHGKDVFKDINNFEEENHIDVIEAIRLSMQFMLPYTEEELAFMWGSVDDDNAGSYTSLSHEVRFKKGLKAEQLDRVADHEAGHAAFSYDFSEFSFVGDAHWGYMWLEDMRMEHAMAKKYPFSQVAEITDEEKGFVEAVTSFDSDYLTSMQPSAIFNYLLSTYAKGLIDRNDVQSLSEMIEGLFMVNIAALALNHLDTAKQIYQSVPNSHSQEECRFAQYKALKLIETVMQDYLEVVQLDVEEKDSEYSDQQKQHMEDQAEKQLERSGGREVGKASDKSKLAKKKLTAEEIEKRKKEIERIKRLRNKAVKEDIVAELDLIDEDLAQIISYYDQDRLQEIEEQLKNTKHPRSLVSAMKKLNDDKLEKRKNRILETVEDIRDMFKQGYYKQSYSSHGAGEGHEGGFGISDANSNPSDTPSRQGRRYPKATTHKKKHAKSKAVRAQARKPRAVKVKARVPVKIERRPELSTITKGQGSELEDAIEEFFKNIYVVDSTWSDNGTFDADRSLEDPVNCYFKSSGTQRKNAKEIVLTGPMQLSEWNPLLDEIFLFLLQKGFHFRVQLDDTQYHEDIGKSAQEPPAVSLSTLKGALMQAQKLSTDKLKGHLNATKQADSYELLTISDIQQKVEGVYLSGAMQNLASEGLKQKSEKKEAQLKPGVFYVPKPIVDPPKIERAELDWQFEELKKLLVSQRIVEQRLIGSMFESSVISQDEQGYIILDLSGSILLKQKFDDLLFLENFSGLKHLTLSSIEITNLSSLSTLDHLKVLKLINVPVSDISILKNVPSLRHLSLVNLLELTDFSVLKELSSLEMLSIASLKQGFTEKVMSYFKYLDNVETLRLANIYDARDISSIEDLINLRELHIDGMSDEIALDGEETKNLIESYLQKAKQKRESTNKANEPTTTASLSPEELDRQIQALKQTLVDEGVVSLTDLSDKGWWDILDTTEDGGIKLTLNGDFSCLNKDLKNLDFLQGYVGLEQLYIYNLDKLDDVSMLSNLTNLINLVITNMDNLKNIESISDLINLRSLVLIDLESVNTFPSCEKLQNLEKLVLRVLSDDVNVSGIRHLKNLQKLTVQGVKSIESTEGFENLTNLERLSMSNLPNLSDISEIAMLTKLKFLRLYDIEKLKNVLPVEKLVNLIDVHLGSLPEIDNISVLHRLINLKRVQLEALPKTGLDDSELLNLGLDVIKKAEEKRTELQTKPQADATPDNEELERQVEELKGELILRGFVSTGDIVNKAVSITDEGGIKLALSGKGRKHDVEVLDLDFLQKYSKIKQLKLLGFKNVQDLSTLKNLTNLTHLELSSFRYLSDLSFITSLTNLSQLKLENLPQVYNFDSLGYLRKLTHLKIDIHKGGGYDLSFLKRLTNLTNLSLKNYRMFPFLTRGGVYDFYAMANLTNLEHLELEGFNDVVGLLFLGKLSNLTHLKLKKLSGFNTLVGIEPLKKLTSLTLESLPDVEVIRVAETLTNLTHLTVEGLASLKEMPALGKLTNLTHLSIGHLQNTSIGVKFLEDLTGLIDLTLYEIGEVRDLEAIDKLINIENLELIDFSTPENYSLPDIQVHLLEKANEERERLAAASTEKDKTVDLTPEELDRQFEELKTELVSRGIVPSHLIDLPTLIGRTDDGYLDITLFADGLNAGPLDFLKDFTGIKKLRIADSNHAVDLSFIQSLPNLVELILSGLEDTQNFTFLDKLTNLQRLELNKLRAFPLNLLEKMQNLTSLSLANMPDISDISVISKLTKLKNLDLDDLPEIDTLDDLSVLINLVSLKLYRINKVESFDWIVSLKKLTSLDVNQMTNLKSLQPISTLDNLVHLKLKGLQKISELSLSNLSNLTTLELSYLNNVSMLNFFEVASLSNLLELTLINNNQLSELGFLENLSKLEKLTLGISNSITNLDPLDSLANLTELQLENLDLISTSNVVLAQIAAQYLDKAQAKRDQLDNAPEQNQEDTTLTQDELDKQFMNLKLALYRSNLSTLQGDDWRLMVNRTDDGYITLTINGNSNYTDGTLVNLDFLKNFTGIKELYISNFNELEDLSAISDLKNLEILTILEASKLKDTEPISQLTNLKELRLTYLGSLESLPFFENLQKVEVIELTNLPILADVTNVEDLPNLVDVTFRSLPKIDNVTCLYNVEHLQGVELEGLDNVSPSDDALSLLADEIELNAANKRYNLIARKLRESNLTHLDMPSMTDDFKQFLEDWKKLTVNKKTQTGDVGHLTPAQIDSQISELKKRLYAEQIINDDGFTDDNWNEIVSKTDDGYIKLVLKTNMSLSKVIVDLDLLEGLTGIKHLEVHDEHNLVDISILNKLPNVEHLFIQNCEALEDLTPIASLTKLKALGLDFIKANTLPSFNNLTSLEELTLNKMPYLQDAAGIGELKQLKFLHLKNLLTLRNVEFIKHLQKLNSLILHGLTIVDDLASLNELKEIQHATLTSLPKINAEQISAVIDRVHKNAKENKRQEATQPVELSKAEIELQFKVLKEKLVEEGIIEKDYVADFPWDRILEIQKDGYIALYIDPHHQGINADFTSLAFLKQFTGIKYLSIATFDNLGDVDFIGDLVNLEELSLTGLDLVQSLEPLRKLQNLSYLEIGDLPELYDFSVFEDLSHLKKLEIYDLPNLGSLSPFETLNDLEEFTASDMKGHFHFTTVEKFKKLKSLKLSNLQDLSVLPDLSKLTNIEKLEIKWLPSLVALPPLDKLIMLRKLSLGGLAKVGWLTDSSTLKLFIEKTIENAQNARAQLDGAQKQKDLSKELKADEGVIMVLSYLHDTRKALEYASEVFAKDGESDRFRDILTALVLDKRLDDSKRTALQEYILGTKNKTLPQSTTYLIGSDTASSDVGGIDMRDLSINTVELTESLQNIPFNIYNFQGFTFKVLNNKKVINIQQISNNL